MPQPCQADVEIWGDFESAASTDALEQAINYSQVAGRVIEIAHAREFNLIETLAYAICREVLSAFPARQVRVRVRKQPVSLADKLEFVQVEVQEP